jgi:hypothetical protein
MASSIPLQLFPSTQNTLQPRKSSLKYRPGEAYELKGLALKVASSSSPKVLPADDHIKHSLFCDPSASPDGRVPNTRTPRRQHARRSAIRPESLVLRNNALSTTDEDDELSPLPINMQFGSSPRRQRSKQFKRPSTPKSISTTGWLYDSPEVFNDNDKLSPLPDKTRFTPVSPKSIEYPASIARSTSTTSKASPAPPYSTPQMRSIFPQYDPNKPLNAQSYYPTSQSPAPRLPSEKISKYASPVERPKLERFDSAVSLVNGYEHVSTAVNSDILAIWNASIGDRAKAVRKVQLGLHEHAGSFSVGLTADKTLFSMEKSLPQHTSSTSPQGKQLAVEKHSPIRDESVPAAQLMLPGTPNESQNDSNTVIPIFPHQAAVHALQAVSNSEAAAEIAIFDPKAKSPEAARLAQDAVTLAHKRFGCGLSKATRRRDSLGAVTAAYTLEHPSLGSVAITVAKSVKQRQTKAKISLHHPSATAAAIAAENLFLASFDFATESCVLDVPSLLALETPYIVDTILAAMFTVATLEQDPTPEPAKFAPPPKSPFQDKKSAKRAQKRKWYRSSSKAIDKAQKELVGQPADVGAPVQAAVALIGLSLKTAVFVLEAGVKMTANVVEGIGHHVATK